jgi:acetyltransferase-like isoleucine patch superfamily enzyme
MSHSSTINNAIVSFLATLQMDRFADKLASLIAKVRLYRLHKAGIPLRFVPQGGYQFELAGPIGNFRIDPTSHIKSDTFIECSGGVSIGRYFHTGRGLTIFSTNHNYKHPTAIPYDSSELHLPVLIGDFVWCGANVTILPGVTIEEGAVIGAGSVVTRNVPKYAVVGGNPAQVLKFRDGEHFERIKSMKCYE